jgi:hypothetical protein
MHGRIHQAVAYSLVGLGGLHALLTPVFYPAFSADAVWFAGTGLALVFLGALNIAHTSSPDRHIQRLCLITNVIGTLFCITIAAVVAEPQAYLAVGLAATALIASLRSATPTGATR